jgi:MATE family multidrug resistance protein
MTVVRAPLGKPQVTPRVTLGALLQLAWPIVLMRATQSVVGFCDALMVAPLGQEALAAATTGALNTFSIVILPMGVVFIVQSFAAQLRGRGELEAAPRYAWYGLTIALLAAFAGVITIPFAPWALGQLEFAPEVHRLMSVYVSIRLLSVGAAVGTEALGNWYGGLGNTRIAMVAGVTTMIANVLGNYLLIEPRFGLPGYGVMGAASASVAASWLGFLVVLVPFLRGFGFERLPGWRSLRFREFLRLLRFGVPNGVNWFLEFAAFTLFINVVVAHLGTTVLAALNVVFQINSISFMPAFGLASAGAILVGEAIGRRAHDEVWPIVKLTGSVGGAWMAMVGVMYLAQPRALMNLFRPDDIASETLLEIGAVMLTLSALWQLFDAMGITLSEALRAAGDTAWCMAARLLLAWLVFTPAAWTAVFVLGGGVGTVMVSLIGYLAALALTLALRFASGRWRSIDLVGSQPELV